MREYFKMLGVGARLPILCSYLHTLRTRLINRLCFTHVLDAYRWTIATDHVHISRFVNAPRLIYGDRLSLMDCEVIYYQRASGTHDYGVDCIRFIAHIVPAIYKQKLVYIPVYGDADPPKCDCCRRYATAWNIPVADLYAGYTVIRETESYIEMCYEDSHIYAWHNLRHLVAQILKETGGYYVE